MLSQSIKNVNTVLTQEYANDETIRKETIKSLLDVMSHWHERVLDLEFELKLLKYTYAQTGTCDSPSLPSKQNQISTDLHLIVDNTGEKS